jgi:hypothetical protein
MENNNSTFDTHQIWENDTVLNHEIQLLLCELD